MAEIGGMVRSIIGKLQTKAYASPQYAALKLAVPCPKCAGEVREEGYSFPAPAAQSGPQDMQPRHHAG